MRLVKIGIGNINPTVGAVRTNAECVLAMAREMAADGVTVACFPEQVIGGYPQEDLVHWGAFVAAQRAEVERIAAAAAELPMVLVLGTVVAAGGHLFNAAAVLHGGRVLGYVPKEKLPTYNIFYESRTLSAGGPGLALWADGTGGTPGAAPAAGGATGTAAGAAGGASGGASGGAPGAAGGAPVGDFLFGFDFGTLAVEVCEDVWSPDGPMRRRCFSGAELVVNISASPFRVGVVATRREMLATRSADNQATLVYANRVGSQDGLVFDGGGYVFQGGRLEWDAPRFVEGWSTCVVDLDRTRRQRYENSTWRGDWQRFRDEATPVPVIPSDAPTADRAALAFPAPRSGSFFLPGTERPQRSPRDQVLDDVFEALALGVADYYRKTGAFQALGVALSGGRDSLLTLLVAWAARERLRAAGTGAADSAHAGGRRADASADAPAAADAAAPGAPVLHAFYMPSRYSGAGTRAAVHRICDELGVSLTTVPIDDALDREVQAVRAMLGDGEPTPITVQNIQARIRATRMWNWANSAGGLFLQTGDMSEKAVGYTTIGGDLEGSLSVIANLPKTVVVALLERLHERYGWDGIRLTLDTEPGPELAEAQVAEAELMPFPILDACLHLYAAEKLSPEEVAAALPALFPELDAGRLRDEAHRFARLFTASIYKWVQAPLSLHIGSLDLERERALQLPVVQRNEWGAE